MKKVRIFIYSIFSFLLIFLLILRPKIYSMVIDGQSMLPTLKSGDKILSLYMKNMSFDYGDIVIADCKSEKTIIIKRLIGKPFDKIEFKNSKLYVNDKEVVQSNIVSFNQIEDMTINLEKDEYFLLGDNRDASIDSRQLGPIKKENLKGKLLIDLTRRIN